jgi:hypothetical protein
MWRLFWYSAAALAVLLGLVLWAAQSSTFLFHHPRTEGLRVEIDKRTGAAVVVQPVAGAKSALPPRPKLAADETEFDFGSMRPLTMGRHEFVLKNAGTAPLKLTLGPTTCKCTLSGLEKSLLAPGEQAAVALEWNSGRHFHYEHAATIYTSDPSRRSLELVIRGRVITPIDTDVAEVVLPPLAPETPATTQVLLFSQTWDRFDVTAVEWSLPGATWQLEPHDPASAKHLGARSVQRLRLTVPGDLPSGDFSGLVRMTVVGPEDATEHKAELPVHGCVLPRMSILGGQADAQGNIDLGTLAQGAGKRVKLLIKVRDREARLDKVQVTATPEFLEAKVVPRSDSQKLGLYDLEIAVPATAPPGQFRSTPRGEVHLDTGHPRLGKQTLGVTFAILPAN